MLIFEHVNWIATIIGMVNRAVHRVAYPSDAPAMAYVPMPDGSSSAEPEIRPGPRTWRKRVSGLDARTAYVRGEPRRRRTARCSALWRYGRAPRWLKISMARAVSWLAAVRWSRSASSSARA